MDGIGLSSLISAQLANIQSIQAAIAVTAQNIASGAAGGGSSVSLDTVQAAHPHKGKNVDTVA